MPVTERAKRSTAILPAATAAASRRKPGASRTTIGLASRMPSRAKAAAAAAIRPKMAPANLPASSSLPSSSRPL